MSAIPSEMTLDTIQSLLNSMPGQDESSRRKLYGAIEVLLVGLVAWLEEEHCREDDIYQTCGVLLDSCFRQTRARSGSRSEQAALTHSLAAVSSLRTELIVLPRAS